MAADDDPITAHGGAEVNFVHVVDHVNSNAADLKRSGSGQKLRPAAAVHVAFDRDHRRDSFQAVEHFNFADVPRMDNEVDAFERRERAWPEQTVGIGDKPDDLRTV